MKKGKSRNKRKKTRSRLLWIAIAVIGIAAVISAVCVAGMLATKENAWKTPEELLVEYMDHIPKQEYEEMYAMLHIEASGNVSQEDFVTRNSAIYEGIEVQNIAVQIIAYDEEQMTVTYQTSFDTVAGTISFENKALFLKDEEGYQLVWDDSLIFPNLASTDKVRVSTTQAERGEILDRNGRVLAGKGTASSVGIVPGKLENREEAIAQIAELVEITPEAIEKKLSAKWVREEAETDCKKLMELYLDIYETADKGIASNVVLDDQTVLEIQKKVKDAGYPIATMVTYSNMENYESVDSFLKECMEGKRGSVVIYEIHNDGGLGRMKFIFDGTDMYVVSTRGIWNADNKPGISYISYTRLKEWKYTEKGWFCYELCVPEPPEVSEIMDGSCLIRIKPMTGEQCEMSERCVRGLGYQGQNLLCSNWNVENMSELDYNGRSVPNVRYLIMTVTRWKNAQMIMCLLQWSRLKRRNSHAVIR